jgi:hypothetical protein
MNSQSRLETSQMEHVEVGRIVSELWRFSPIVIGGAIGYAFYRLVGCKTGVCPITRNPWLSILYGAFIGAMMMPK